MYTNLIHNGKKVDARSVVVFTWEPEPTQTDAYLESRAAFYGEVYAITPIRFNDIKEVVVILNEVGSKSAFIQQMKAYFPGFGATDFRTTK